MKTLIQAAVVTLFAASSAHAQQVVQWKVSDGGNGHWYRVVPSEVGDWDVARTAALAWRADLASIGSAEENLFVRNLLNAGGLHNFFIGALSRTGSPCDPSAWRWSDGTAWTYANWDEHAGEPGCTETRATMYSSGYWHNYHPAGQGVRGAIVEWSADCNGDGVVDYGQCRDGTLPDYDGDNIPDCCESNSPCISGNYPVEWRIEDGGNGHWYQLRFAPSHLAWTQARDAAVGIGGHLATLTSASESRFAFGLVTYLNQPGPWLPGPWLGGFQPPEGPEPTGGWRWVTGEVWNYTNWCPVCPNNFYCSDPRDEDFLHFYGPAGDWNDASDANTGCLQPINSIMVEWSADCNGDGQVDFGQILRGQLVDNDEDGVPDACQAPTCAQADIYRDSEVNGADLGILLAQWGPVTPATESDLDHDGTVGGADLGLLLSFWGACP